LPKRLRLSYAVWFFALLLVEILIALFVKDRFVRPYVGDMLVTVLLCCLARVAFPTGMPALPLYVFAFAAAVELGQYFDLVALLGLEHSKFFSTLLGRTFSLPDLFCYAAGCLLFQVLDRIIRRNHIERSYSYV